MNKIEMTSLITRFSADGVLTHDEAFTIKQSVGKYCNSEERDAIEALLHRTDVSFESLAKNSLADALKRPSRGAVYAKTGAVIGGTVGAVTGGAFGALSGALSGILGMTLSVPGAIAGGAGGAAIGGAAGATLGAGAGFITAWVAE